MQTMRFKKIHNPFEIISVCMKCQMRNVSGGSGKIPVTGCKLLDRCVLK